MNTRKTEIKAKQVDSRPLVIVHQTENGADIHLAGWSSAAIARKSGKPGQGLHFDRRGLRALDAAIRRALRGS